MRRARWAAVVAVAMIVMSAAPASAAAFASGEVTGGSVAARLATTALRDAWAADVVARGLTTPSPQILTAVPGVVISGPIGTTATGVTTSVERTRYTADRLNPVFVAASTNQGTAACTGSGLTMQGSSPRPSILAGNAGCTNGTGTVYTEAGGAGEATTRDAVEFSFSRPVAGFGAWFGDLETRTDGLGVPAIVRLLDPDGDLVSEWQVVPEGDQSLCGNAGVGCGNNASRWIGFTTEPGQTVMRMVVIVGDEDAAGTALDEGLGFVGPSIVDGARLTLVAALSTSRGRDTDQFEVQIRSGSAAGPVVSASVAATTAGAGDAVTAGTGATGSLQVVPGASYALGQVASGTTGLAGYRTAITCIDANARQSGLPVDAPVSSWTTITPVLGADITCTLTNALLPVGLTMAKSAALTTDADDDGLADVGDTITFSFDVANTGQAALGDLTIADALVSPAAPEVTVSCPETALAAAATVVCTSSGYVVTQADVDHGYVANAASARADPPSSPTIATAESTTSTPTDSQAAIALVKSISLVDADVDGRVDEGESVLFSFRVENTGTVTLREPRIDDPALEELGVPISCPPGPLAPGEVRACTSGAYAVTATDAERGVIRNTARAQASTSADVAVVSESSTAQVQVQAPAESVDPDGPDGPAVTDPEVDADAVDPELVGTGSAVPAAAIAVGSGALIAGIVLLAGRRRIVARR